MPEANRMTYLMHHNAQLITIFPDGNALTSVSFSPNVRATPVRKQSQKVRSSYLECDGLLFSLTFNCIDLIYCHLNR